MPTNTKLLIKDLQLYPNPTTGYLYINTADETIYQIMSASGTKVMQGTISRANPADMHALPNGLY